MPRGIYPRRNHDNDPSPLEIREMEKRVHDLETQLAVSEAEREEAKDAISSYKETQRILEAKIEALQDALVAITRAEY